jgi:hypothetical protein
MCCVLWFAITTVMRYSDAVLTAPHAGGAALRRAPARRRGHDRRAGHRGADGGAPRRAGGQPRPRRDADARWRGHGPGLGLGCIVALYYHASTSYHIH